uniref:Carrier homolog 2-like n=1 Tax=Hirondellea gigas TaxID=1518452 RepID=A0A6A7FTE0_9CRUS
MAKAEESGWMNVMVRVGLNACTHPIEYAKVLIQIGHEPLPAYKSRTIFGKEKLFYPSIFSYIRHIKARDGFVGCYNGLVPKLSSNIVSGLVFQRVVEIIPIKDDDRDPDDLSKNEKCIRFVKRTGRETAARCAAILVSQPLHVIAVRTMAQFVGQDGAYTNVFTSAVVIYREEGVLGFFAGLIPRILCDIGALWLSNTLVFCINNYVIEDKDVKTYVTGTVKFLASAMWYPLQVVSTCMSVTGSDLVAAQPPLMPRYASWTECYSQLKSIGCLKRGSTLLWRTYTGPVLMTLAGAPVVPDTMLFAKTKLN